MEEQLSLEFLRVVENGAIAAARTMGFGDRHKADEVAVEAFLQGRIGFDHIPKVIEEVLSATEVGKLESIKQVLEVDARAREAARHRVELFGGRSAGLRPVSAGSGVD